MMVRYSLLQWLKNIKENETLENSSNRINTFINLRSLKVRELDMYPKDLCPLTSLKRMKLEKCSRSNSFRDRLRE